jgi:type I restriction enzyme S subunit
VFRVFRGLLRGQTGMTTEQALKPGWKMVKFGDVVRNANLTERDPLEAGIDRIVGLEHLDPENLHIRRWNTPEDSTSFTRKFVAGQTLFGKRRAYQRKVAFAEFAGVCSSDILTFESKNPQVLLPELLPFICQTDAFFDYALGTSAGSLSPRTSWNALKQFEFPLPPLAEQQRIAELLWAADEAVGKYKITQEDVEILQETVFRDLLHNGIPGVNSPSKTSTFGRIPEHWEIMPLAEVADVAYGISESVASNTDPNIGWPILTGANITLAGKLDLTKVVYIAPPKKDAFILKKGDLLFNWRSGSSEHVGKTTIFNLESNWTYASFILRIRPLHLMNRYFLLWLLDFMKKRNLFSSATSQQVNFKMNASMLRDLAIVVPPIDEQDSIVKIVNQIVQRKLVLTTFIEKQESLVKRIANELLL